MNNTRNETTSPQETRTETHDAATALARYENWCNILDANYGEPHEYDLYVAFETDAGKQIVPLVRVLCADEQYGPMIAAKLEQFQHFPHRIIAPYGTHSRDQATDTVFDTIIEVIDKLTRYLVACGRTNSNTRGL